MTFLSDQATLGKNDQTVPKFLSLNLNDKIPAIIA